MYACIHIISIHVHVCAYARAHVKIYLCGKTAHPSIMINLDDGGSRPSRVAYILKYLTLKWVGIINKLGASCLAPRCLVLTTPHTYIHTCITQLTRSGIFSPVFYSWGARLSCHDLLFHIPSLAPPRYLLSSNPLPSQRRARTVSTWTYIQYMPSRLTTSSNLHLPYLGN